VHASGAKGSCVSWEDMAVFENETAFTIGVICLGLFPVALLLAALFAK
jgi:hypothetical protein